MRSFVFICSFFLYLVSTSCLQARLIPHWPYEKLFKQADLVVIAEAVSEESTKDTFRYQGKKSSFLGLNTTFKALHFLKGKRKSLSFTVIHFRYPSNTAAPNGALFMRFQNKGGSFLVASPGARKGELRLKAKIGLGKPHYLLFLKKRKDGRYEGVTGQYDFRLSVKEIRSPLPQTLYGNRK